MLRDRRQHKDLRYFTLAPPAIKDELFILSQRL
jgi:hypothetical protein